ncbi:MAG: outer membrane beta-barrel protein [Bacteroidota bacterium]
MKKICFLVFLGVYSFHLHAQNSIGIDAGYIRTHTSVAEYIRTGRSTSLLDSVALSPDLGSFQAAFRVSIDLGKRFFFSPGFHYARKGLKKVSFNDSINYYVDAIQHYAGFSLMTGYQFDFKKSRFGIFLETGPLIDFAVGKPNNGSLFSGSQNRIFMPFTRYNEVDFSWTIEAGPTYKIGPGKAMVRLTYRYGLSDVLEDTFIIGRSSSFGISAGYSMNLGK